VKAEKEGHNRLTFNHLEDTPMVAATHITAVGKTTIWAGRIISSFVGLFLLFDGIIKVLNLSVAVEATTQLGYSADVVVGLGLLQLICLIAYAFPRTSLLGAILLTGYLGGAVASQLRIGMGTFSMVFPVMMGALIWGGLLLRDRQLRALMLRFR
jgi:hypothetical protein